MGKLPVPRLNGSDISADELAVYRAIKPYIGRCLHLNHEINNPLAGIIGYTEFLAEEATTLSPDHRRFVQHILEAAERIQRIVEDLCVEKISLTEQIDLKTLLREFEPPPPESH